MIKNKKENHKKTVSTICIKNEEETIEILDTKKENNVRF